MNAAMPIPFVEKLAPARHSDGRPDFRKLLGDAAWNRLPGAVRERFDVDAHRTVVIYRGETLVKASRCGRCFAQLCRLIGTPVAPFVGERVPMLVRVFGGPNGVVWERRYEFADRAPVVVRSTKQMDEGALVEGLNAGLHMRLRVYEECGQLHFLSAGYYFRAGPLRFNLPQWFLPGVTHVVHEDLGAGNFRFTMRTEHRWFGEMFFQDGVFN